MEEQNMVSSENNEKTLQNSGAKEETALPDPKPTAKVESGQKQKQGIKKQKEKQTPKKQGKKNNKNDYSWVVIPEELTRKIYFILAMVSSIVGITILALLFFPASRVEDVSLGNFFAVSFESIEYWLSKIDFINVSYEYSSWYGSIFTTMHIVTICCVVAAYKILESAIKRWIEYFDSKTTAACMQIKYGIFGTVVKSIIEVVLFVLVFAFIALQEKYYAFSMLYQKIIVVLVILEIITCDLVKVIHAIKCEKIKDNVAYKNVYVKKTHAHITIMQDALSIIFIFVLSGGLLMQIMYENSYDIADKSRPDKLYMVYKPIELSEYENPIVVGEVPENRIFEIRSYDIVVEEINFSAHKSWSREFGNNHYYYKSLIENIYKEIKELMPEEITSNADMDDLKESLGKYTKKLEKLYYKKQVLENQLYRIPVTVEGYNCDDNKIVTEYVFNTNKIDKTVYKYGEAPLTILSLGKESISIENDIFEKGTDFSETKIKATVIYKDGSFKISMITPDNYKELNEASVGTHTIEWHDAWGEYTAEIRIR